MKKSLILSVVHKMPFAAVKPFLVSLRQTGFTGDVVFFVSNASLGMSEDLRRHGVRVIPFGLWTIRMRRPVVMFWPLWRRLLAGKRSFEWKRDLARRVYNLFFQRFVLLHDFLAAEGAAYGRVMITDCRDVIFQRDPLDLPLDIGLWCFLEAGSQRIGSCPFNRRMIQDCFGPGILSDLGQERVSCAGVTLGDSASVLAYLRAFVERSFSVQRMQMISGSDQGLHNFLVYRGHLPGLRLLTSDDGVVATLGAVPRAEIRLNAAGEVVTSDDRVIPTLHQYDRHHDLRDKLWKELRE